eukprot:scaffold126104_cov20-Prasinocladus_malaysianus.AAC.1
MARSVRTLGKGPGCWAGSLRVRVRVQHDESTSAGLSSTGVRMSGCPRLRDRCPLSTIETRI